MVSTSAPSKFRTTKRPRWAGGTGGAIGGGGRPAGGGAGVAAGVSVVAVRGPSDAGGSGGVDSKTGPGGGGVSTVAGGGAGAAPGTGRADFAALAPPHPNRASARTPQAIPRTLAARS